MMEEKPTLMQLQVSLYKKILISAGIMLALILLVYIFNVPNPNMILIVGLVLCSALFGFGGGVVAAVIMVVYTLYFFSTGHSYTEFTPQNLQKVFVSIVGVAADMVLVCLLKRAELDAFLKIDRLTQRLHHENAQLQRQSMTDALTGIRNRMALRQDYDTYQGRTVTVMMLDLNDFKRINDTRGHEEGDRILHEIGRLLSETFGEEHCYRYGGDEFLVIIPDLSESAFKEKLDTLISRSPVIKGAGPVGFAVGHVRALLGDPGSLRDLISNADERMYQAKRDKACRTEPQDGKGQEKLERTEFTVEKLKSFLEKMSGEYDLARVVDPNECRILELQEDGHIRMADSCYGIWESEQKCLNCSSALACRTGCHQEKAERFRDQLYVIQSNPVSIRLPDGSVYDAVIELVNVDKQSDRAANNRAAENIGNRAARYQALHDSLTNVLNSGAFYELARERIRDNPERSWMMITANIMNFRYVNTLFGVLKGNEVLVRTATSLKRIADQASGLCGRLGGDQFALLLPQDQYREEALQSTAQTLAQAFNSGIYTFCIHFGVYKIDDASLPVSVMCGRANSALRTIREDLSRNVACFDEAIRQKMMLEQEVIGAFEGALRDGQFQMYLQPMVGENGTVLGAEALARWQKPDGRLMMPGDFIETLENAGLIQKLDMCIWELAVRQLSAWKGTDKENLTISVNMSAKDFYSIDVYEVLTKLVDRYGVDCSLLRLEITETALLVEPEKSDAVVSRLREKGFLVEIDDFGKGYSSLSMLKDIQADVLKIDMSFLREIKDSRRSRIILESVINMADSLGMEVIIEGVETEQQLQTLSSMGCRHFQGYYFSRPMPVEEFEAKY